MICLQGDHIALRRSVLSVIVELEQPRDEGTLNLRSLWGRFQHSLNSNLEFGACELGDWTVIPLLNGFPEKVDLNYLRNFSTFGS